MVMVAVVKTREVVSKTWGHWFDPQRQNNNINNKSYIEIKYM